MELLQEEEGSRNSVSGTGAGSRAAVGRWLAADVVHHGQGLEAGRLAGADRPQKKYTSSRWYQPQAQPAEVQPRMGATSGGATWRGRDRRRRAWRSRGQHWCDSRPSTASRQDSQIF